jgi:hypothetical protein
MGFPGENGKDGAPGLPGLRGDRGQYLFSKNSNLKLKLSGDQNKTYFIFLYMLYLQIM